MPVTNAFLKRFYFVVVLLSCNIFFLCGSGFCKRIKNLFFGENQSPSILIDDDNMVEPFFSDSECKHRLKIRKAEKTYDNFSPNINMKLVLVSALDKAVGKSSIYLRLMGKKFEAEPSSTFGYEFFNSFYIMECTGACQKKCFLRMQCWDTGSKENYKELVSSLFRKNCAGIVFVYDITDSDSLTNLKDIIENIRDKKGNDETVMFLLGNKFDLENERNVTADKAKEFATQYGLTFLGACSAKSNEYVSVGVRKYFSDEDKKEEEIKESQVEDVMKDIAYNLYEKGRF